MAGMEVSIINDCAFVGLTIKSELDRRGVKVNYFPRTRSLWDKTGGALLNALRAKGITHVNYALQDAYFVRLLKNIDVLHVHGSDFRFSGHNWKWRRMVRGNIRKADKVLVATPDLLDEVRDFNETTEYLPNPIDIDMFAPREKSPRSTKRAAYFVKPFETPPIEIIDQLREEGYEVVVHKGRRYPWDAMPTILNTFDLLIDQQTFSALSKTALEAMSCGLKIVPHKGISQSNWLMDGKSNREFILMHHDARVVVDRLMEIYEESK